MKNEWEELQLKDLYEFSSGLSKPRTEFGFGYQFLAFKDVFNNFFVPDELYELVNSTEKERESCSIKRGDVFLTRTSETMEDLGMSCVALKDYDSATFNGFTKRLRPKEGVDIVPEYAGYFFRSPKFRSEVTAMSSLSTRASLNNEMLGRLTMVLPTVKEQTAIGFLLKTFDDKIRVNLEISKNLEQMAQAIFKSWFVDFDPVKAKAQGKKLFGIDAETAALFPDSFEDSPLGKIPNGWNIGIVSDLGSIICGKTPSTSDRDNYNGQIPFITIPDMRGKVFVTRTETNLSEIGANTQKSKELPKNTVCVSCIATPGIVALTSKRSHTNQQINSIKCNEEISPYWVYFKMQQMSEQIVSGGAGGSATLNLNKGSFSQLKLIIPNVKLVKAFDDAVKLIFKKILINYQQNLALSETRDLLLPKLLSGEIQVEKNE